jgi:hypothetical protein
MVISSFTGGVIGYFFFFLKEEEIERKIPIK